MLIAFVLIILLLSTAAAFVMKIRGVRRSLVWLTLAGASLLLWLVILFIPQGMGASLNWDDWFFSSGSHISLHFHIDSSNWGIMLALLCAHSAFLFTRGAKQDFNRDYIYWIAEAGMIALTYAVLAAADLWSLIITWTALDAGFLVYWMLIRRTFDQEKLARTFIFKLAGSLLLVFSTARIAGEGGSLLLADIPAANSALVFLAAIMHSGMFPMEKPESEGTDHAGTLRYLAFLLPFASSLFLLTYLPDPRLPLISGLLIRLAALAFMVFYSIQWLRSPGEREGAYQLALAFGAFAAYQYLTQNQEGLQNWFVILLVFNTWLLLHERRGRATLFFPIVLVMAASGLPFSLVSYGSSGILANGVGFQTFVMIFFHVILLGGFTRLMLREKADFNEMEPSSQLVYLVGLFITIISVLMASYRSMGTAAEEFSYPWAGFLVVLSILGFNLWLRTGGKALPLAVKREVLRAETAQRIFSFDWFFTTADLVLKRIRPLVTGFSLLLEGEGGILWSIVFLALLATLIGSG